jgi:hypothetical protein
MSRHVLGVVVPSLALSLTLTACAQDQPAAAQQPGEEQIQQLMEAYAKPGKPHERLQKLVGEWDVAVKSYEGAPDKPVESKAVARMETMLEGRFLRQTFEGEFGGQKFTGIGITGYDNAQEKYTGVWMDSFGTGMMHITGEYDESTGTMTEMGEATMPIGVMKFRMVTKEVNDDKFTFTMYMVLSEEVEQIVMDNTYTRRK